MRVMVMSYVMGQSQPPLHVWQTSSVVVCVLCILISLSLSLHYLSVVTLRTGAIGVHREKISSFVDFPLNGLDMSPYCKPLPAPPEGEVVRGGSEEGGGVDERYLYDLVAVCNHYGRMGFGHYTAFAREWDGSECGAVLRGAVAALRMYCVHVRRLGLVLSCVYMCVCQATPRCAMTRGAATTTR